MSKWSLYKTVSVTNPKNVLVQIPGCVVAQWGLKKGDSLGVNYDEETNTITIRPAISGGSRPTEEMCRLVQSTT